MKIIRYHFIAILLLFSFIAKAQENSETVSSVKEIPKEVYFAGIIKEQNKNIWFPSLEYWGVQSVNWSMSKNDVEKQNDHTSKGLNVFSKTTTVLKTDFISEITFSKNVGNTKISQYKLKYNSTDKKELLSLFNSLMKEANLTYHAPTTYISQPQIIDGEDGFLNSIIKEYKVEWAGQRTRIVLTLTNSEVSLVYHPVEGNDYSELEKLANEI